MLHSDETAGFGLFGDTLKLSLRKTDIGLLGFLLLVLIVFQTVQEVKTAVAVLNMLDADVDPFGDDASPEEK